MSGIGDKLKAMEDRIAELESRVDPLEESKRITTLSRALQENERLRAELKRCNDELVVIKVGFLRKFFSQRRWREG